MKKNLEITLDQAKELLVSMPTLSEVIYNSFPELKPKPVVFDKWEDLGVIEGYYIDGADSSLSHASVHAQARDRNIYKTQKQALSSLAYAQLTQLMAATGDCDVDWSNGAKTKYCITRNGNGVNHDYFGITFQFIAFNTKSVRDEFFRKHEGLIKQFFQL